MTAPVLTAESISKSYGKRSVLNGVELRVEPGTQVGVVGENGSGKSTLLRILAGVQRPDRGVVFRHGSLGYCPQEAVLNDALTIRQHLAFFREAYRITDLSRAYELIDDLGFTGYLDTTIRALSGGTKQKLNLVAAMMHDPALLLLDEPYQGFDWETYLEFWRIADKVRAGGRSILVISHLVFDQDRLDAVHHLRSGRLEDATSEQADAHDQKGL